MEAGASFEIIISDEWSQRFRPSRPVMVSYVETIGQGDHRFRIIGGSITDTETKKDLSEISIFRSSGGNLVDHLSGVKVGVGGIPVGRALLVDPCQPLPDWLK